MSDVKVLTPTCTLGYGFSHEALQRGMEWGADVIAVDAGSTDPGPYYLGSGETLVSEISIKKDLTQMLKAANRAKIPVIVGSAGGAGAKAHVDATVALVREVAQELGIHFKLAWIYSDIQPQTVATAVRNGHIKNFEANFELTEELATNSAVIVAQMGHEPIVEALKMGAEVIIAGRACDDSVIAAYPIYKNVDPGLAIHMGKILECGAFCAEPHGTDVMLGHINNDGFTLEPGSMGRRASLTSVAAHSLYEREDPFLQHGPGHSIDLSACSFEQITDREVHVKGSTFVTEDEYWIKLEGVKQSGFRSICIAGIRCPSMIAQIDEILAKVKAEALAYFESSSLNIAFHVYGKNGVMQELEPDTALSAKELCLIIDVMDQTQAKAHAAAHFISGTLLHCSFPGQYNTAGNLAFPYSPSEINVGPVFEFSAYHLMKTNSPSEHFKTHYEEV